MLSLNFEIHQDGKDAEAQARGVVAALVAIYGPQIVPASYERVGEVERATGPVVINRVIYDRPAPDGYPAEADDLAVAPEGAKVAASLVPERDTAGIPWDERIHASTKTTNKDGTWTRRRNTPDEVFDKVMAELKAANTARTLEAAAGLTAPAPTPEPTAAPSAAEAFTPPASVVIPPYTAPVADPSSQTVPAVPVTVPMPSAPPAPVLPAPPAADDKAAEAVEIMKAVNAKQVPRDKLAEIMASAGLKGLGEVFTAPIEIRRKVATALAEL